MRLQYIERLLTLKGQCLQKAPYNIREEKKFTTFICEQGTTEWKSNTLKHASLVSSSSPDTVKDKILRIINTGVIQNKTDYRALFSRCNSSMSFVASGPQA